MAIFNETLRDIYCSESYDLSNYSYFRTLSIPYDETIFSPRFVRVELNSSNFDFSKSNGKDLIFINPRYGRVPHCVTYWNSTEQKGVVWLKLPTVYKDTDCGYALNFTALGQNITIPNSSSLNPTYQLTFLFWIKFNSLSSGNQIFKKTDQFYLNIYSSSIDFGIKKNNTWRGGYYSIDQTFETNRWYHLGLKVWYDSEKKWVVFRYYVNGKKVASFASITYETNPFDSTTNPFIIGSESGDSLFLNATIDEFLFYTTALTEEQIIAHYNNGLRTNTPPTSSGLALHLHLDEGSGSFVSDSSGNNNNGTLNGSPQWVEGKGASAGNLIYMLYGGTNVPDYSSKKDVFVFFTNVEDLRLDDENKDWAIHYTGSIDDVFIDRHFPISGRASLRCRSTYEGKIYFPNLDLSRSLSCFCLYTGFFGFGFTSSTNLNSSVGPIVEAKRDLGLYVTTEFDGHISITGSGNTRNAEIRVYLDKGRVALNNYYNLSYATTRYALLYKRIYTSSLQNYTNIDELAITEYNYPRPFVSSISTEQSVNELPFLLSSTSSRDTMHFQDIREVLSISFDQLKTDKFKYRRRITIKNRTSTALSNYPVLLILYSPDFDFSKFRSDHRDILFFDSEFNELEYWVEKWDIDDGRAYIWVKIPSLSANGTITIYMYYGNADYNWGYGNTTRGKRTFLYFTDFSEFNEGPINGQEGWVLESCPPGGYANIVIVDGKKELEIYSTDYTYDILYIRKDISVPSTNIALRMYEETIDYNERQYLSFWQGDNYWRGDFLSLDPGHNRRVHVHVYKNGNTNGNFTYDLSYSTEAPHICELVILPDAFMAREGMLNETMGTWAFCVYQTEDYNYSPSSDPFDKIKIGGQYNRKYRVKYLLIRPYVHPEPQVTIGKEEILYYVDGPPPYGSDVEEVYTLYAIPPSSIVSYNAEFSFLLFFYDNVRFLQNLVEYLSSNLSFPVIHPNYFLSEFLSYNFNFSDSYRLKLDTSWKDIFSLEAFLSLALKTSLQEKINFEDLHRLIFFGNEFYDTLNYFSDSLLFTLKGDLSSILLLYDLYFYSPFIFLSDILPFYSSFSFSLRSDFSDKLRLYSELGSSGRFSLVQKDLLEFIDASVFYGKRFQKIFFHLTFPTSGERPILYSFGSTSIQITGFNEIVTAEDGIYIFDEERTIGDLIFDFKTLEKAKLKRLDKIFADTDLTEATVITEKGTYTYSGEKWISVAKGLMAKEIKVLLENLEKVEFVAFRLGVLRRPK